MNYKDGLIYFFSVLSLGSSLTLMHTTVLHASCCGNEQRERGICPNASCEWARRDAKCNEDEDCCPGKRCTSFGYCQSC
jgi:hypothetical protein